VQFRLDGVPLSSEDTTAPYEALWDTSGAANGPHTLTAVARDTAGNQTVSAAVLVTASNDTRPTVTITTPASGATVAGSVQLSAVAADDLQVLGVQFEVDGVSISGEDTVAPFDVWWDTSTHSNGPHTLTAVARDAVGPRTKSAAVIVTVANDLAAPTVTVTAPANGATVAGTISVLASATDDVGVVGVEVLLDGVRIGTEDTSAPYNVGWDTTTTTNGEHTLAAVARDAGGRQATSAPVIVTVSNVLDPNAPSLVGRWSTPSPWPLVAVHMTLLHTGEVLVWEGQDNGGVSARLWNPATGQFIAVANAMTNIFCSSHTALADGRILVVGGHGPDLLGSPDANIFVQQPGNGPRRRGCRSRGGIRRRRHLPTGA
jgi:hypothetical protein